MKRKNKTVWAAELLVFLLAIFICSGKVMATSLAGDLEAPYTVQLSSTRSLKDSILFIEKLKKKMEPAQFSSLRHVFIDPFHTVRTGLTSNRAEAYILLENVRKTCPGAVLIHTKKPEILLSGAAFAVDPSQPASSITLHPIQPIGPETLSGRDDTPQPPIMLAQGLPQTANDMTAPISKTEQQDKLQRSGVSTTADQPMSPLTSPLEVSEPVPGNSPPTGLSALAGALRILPGITLRQEHNDNIGFKATNKTDDNITTISPSLKIEGKQERYSFIVEDQIDFLIYADHDQFNSVDNTLSGGLEFAATPRLSTSLSAKHVRDSRPDRDIETTGLVDGTSRRESQSYSGALNYMLTEKAMTGISVSHGKIHYDDPGFVDSRTQGAGINFGYSLDKWLAETTARLYLNSTRYDYPGSEIENYSATTGLEHRFSETVSGYAYLGARHTKSEIDVLNSDTDSWGRSGQAQLKYSGEKTTTAFNLSHDIAAGRSDTTGVTERSSASIDINSKLTSEWSINLNTVFHLNRSERRTLAGAEIDEQTWRVSPSIRYTFSPDLSFILNYAYTLHDNRELKVRREQNRVFLRMVLEHAIFE